jgi:general secretion pathway protein F
MEPPAYTYRALDAQGRELHGRVEALGEVEVARELVRQGLVPLDVRRVSGADGASRAQLRPGVVRQAGLVEQLSLVQELSTLLAAGISLSEALPSLASAYAGQALGPPLAKLGDAVRAGAHLSDALRDSGLGLPPYVLALVAAGEASGELAAALADAAAQMDYERSVAQELRNALVYPSVLVLAGALAVSIVLVGVVPRFAALLRSSRADVPALSRWIIEGGVYVKQHLLVFGLGGIALAGCLAYALASPGVRGRVLQACAGLPVLGPWLMRVEIGRWATVLSRLLANRVPIIKAIALSTSALRLQRLRDDLAATGSELERGKTLTDVLAALGWFPAARLNLVRVGERSGELPRMLATLGAMETEAARTLQKRVLALIEPAAILIIGAVIGVIMVAVMMAITSLNTVAL